MGHSVVITETVCNPPTARANTAELMFEAYGVPSLVFGSDVAFRYGYCSEFK